jgi:ribosomal-protein-serine acetyltransferase
MTERRALTTERLRLEPTGPEHADGIWAAAEPSLAELRPWLYWAVKADLETTRMFTQRCVAEWDREEWGFSIIRGDELIGGVGLNTFVPFLMSAQLGYWLRSDCADNGYTTEAAAAVVDFAFEGLRLHRIELHAAPENLASVRVAEKLGFTRVGLLRDGTRGADGWHDCYVFDLLATERANKSIGSTVGS